MPAARKSRARRVLGVIGAVVGTTVTFVAATAAAAVVHLDAPATRRLVTAQVNGILHDQFAGDVTIEHLGGLSLRGIEGVRFRVKDPTGMQVIFVDGARVRLQTFAAAKSALFGKGDIVIPVDLVSIEHVDANIEGDPSGNLRIANAFGERTPTPAKPANPSARGVRVDAPVVALRSAWVHGQAPGAPPLDGELHELAARAHYDGKLIQADLEKVDLVTRGLPRGVDPRGRLVGQFRMPSSSGKDMSVVAGFDGAIAGVPTKADAKMDGQQLDVVVDGRDPSGQGVRSTFGEVSIQDDVTLHAEAHGELPRLGAKAHVALGRGTVDVDGKVDLSEGTKADATVVVRHIDLHRIIATLPASDVGLDTTVQVVIAKSGAIAGTFALDTQPGSVDGVALPIVKARGGFTKETAHAEGTVIDPRGSAEFAADLRTERGDQIAEGRVHADVPDLGRLPDLGARMRGRAVVDGSGRVNLATKALAGKAHVVAGGLAYGAHTIDNATVVATASGTHDRPLVEVGVHAGGIASGEQKLAVADVRGKVEVGAVTTIRDAQVDVVRSGKTISVTADRVQVGGPTMEVEGALVTGLGEPLKASFSRSASEIHVKLDGPSIDLARVALIAGQPDAVRTGTLAIKGDVSLGKDSAVGELHIAAAAVSTPQIHGAKLDLDARFTGRKLDITMVGALAEAGRIELAANQVVIGGPPLDPKSWKRAHGRAKFSANLDIEKLATLAPKDSLPFSELGGQLVVAGALRRDSANVLPELSIHTHTRGLVIAGKGTTEPDHDPTHGKRVEGIQPWRSEGIDVSFDARVDATSGFGEVAFHSVDQKGTLVGFDAKSDLPYAQLVNDPANALELLEKTPFVARLVIPKRALADFPQVAGTRNVPGTVEVEVDFSGTALDPKIALVAHGRDVRSPSLSANLAGDIDVTLDYDGQKGDLLAKVATQRHEALEIGAHADIRARDLLQPRPGEPLAWGGSARVKLAKFPLQSIAPIGDRRVRGHVSGEAVLQDLHKDAKLDAKLVFEDLTIGRAKYESGTVAVKAQDGRLTAGVRLDQRDGFLDLQAVTGLTWGEALVPAPDPAVDTQAHLEAKGFRAAALLPFVQGQLNELDGLIDANATVKVGPGFKDPTMEGKLAYHDGTLQLAAVGEEYKNARLDVSFLPGGVIKVTDVFLKGTAGELTADAEVKTRGLGLASATANLNISRKRPLDLAFQGQAFGAVSGKVKLAATNSEDGKNLAVVIDVPTLDLELPQKLKSGVQALEEQSSNIRVGVFRDEKTFVKLPLDKEDLAPVVVSTAPATTIDVDVRLGEITVIQGSAVKVVLGGAPHIKVAATTQVTGQIEVKEGSKIDVQGKTFRITRGVITFQPQDTANPIVVATAEWTADNGSQIYADFVGPVKTGKVTLRSDPSMPRNEVLAMILFGTADGANPSPTGSAGSTNGTTKAAASVGGGFATQGLTEGLDDLTGIQATAKIDTTRSANPAPEIEFQIARRISLSFEHVLGTPPISQPDVNLATVDWRFKKNWSLETTFGDKGLLQTDAIWQKRY